MITFSGSEPDGVQRTHLWPAQRGDSLPPRLPAVASWPHWVDAPTHTRVRRRVVPPGMSAAYRESQGQDDSSKVETAAQVRVLPRLGAETVRRWRTRWPPPCAYWSRTTSPAPATAG